MQNCANRQNSTNRQQCKHTADTLSGLFDRFSSMVLCTNLISTEVGSLGNPWGGRRTFRFRESQSCIARALRGNSDRSSRMLEHRVQPRQHSILARGISAPTRTVHQARSSRATPEIIMRDQKGAWIFNFPVDYGAVVSESFPPLGRASSMSAGTTRCESLHAMRHILLALARSSGCVGAASTWTRKSCSHTRSHLPLSRRTVFRRRRSLRGSICSALPRTHW